MDRLTLHQAQERVAAAGRRIGVAEVQVNWTRPLQEAIRYSIGANAQAVLSAKALAALDIRDALFAYHTHLAFEAGRTFADAATIRYLRIEGARFNVGELAVVADEIQQGLHYAEPMHEGT